jgi:hypothetical protein
MEQTKKQLIIRFLKRILFALLLCIAAVLLLDVGCIFRHITGVPCPGCGMTRACLAALQLDFKAAFYWHPLWILPFPLIVLSIFRPNGFFKNPRYHQWLMLSLLLLVLLVYFIRMLCLFPDTPPMDYNVNSLFAHLWHLLQH